MIPANAALPGSYDYGEAARSRILCRARPVGRITAARGRARLAWSSGGAIAMGIGIWAMHLKGMLAFRLPVPVEHDWPTILAALIVAIVASAVAPYVASRPKVGLGEALTGSEFMGGGIAGLHYLGMAAMRLPCHHSVFSPFDDVFHLAGNPIFSNCATDGIRSARGDEMDCSAKAWHRHCEGSRCLRDALHRNGRTFIPASPPNLFHAANISPLASMELQL